MPEQKEGTREGAKVARRAGIVGGFTLLSRVLGYVRDAVLSHVFGAGVAYDAFIIAQTIPNFLRRLVAEGSLVIAFVPILAAEKEAGGLQAMRRYTSAVLGILLPVLFMFAALGMLFPEAAVKMFASGFDPARAEVAAFLTRIMMPYIVFVSLVALAGGVLNTQGIFSAPAAAPVLLNIAIVGSTVFLRGYFDAPIEAVAWGFIAGGVLQLVLQIPFLRRTGMLVGPSFEPRYPAVITLAKRMLPAVFGIAVYQLNIIVIRQLGSALPTGQLTWYYNATRLQEFALGVFAVSVSVAALPTLSEHAAKSDWAALRRTFLRALRVTNFITIPTSVGLFVAAGPLVAVLFGHGRFTAQDAIHTAELLQILVVAVVAIGVVRVTVPTFYALGDTKTPVVAASVSLLITFGLGTYLVTDHEIRGLTVAMTVAAFAQLAVLVLLLERTLAKRRAESPPASESEVAPEPQPSVWTHGLKCLLAVAPSAVGCHFAQSQFDFHALNNVAGAGILGVIGGGAGLGYVVFAKVLRVGEVELFVNMVRRRLRR